MPIRRTVLVASLLLAAIASDAQDRPAPVVSPGLAAGKLTYLQHCAACHGATGRGNGPAAAALKSPPPDLRTLSMRHGGEFPEDYVIGVVRFGYPFSAHGSSDMPIWGPLFSSLENGNEVGIRQRIKNLCDYLASLQDKES